MKTLPVNVKDIVKTNGVMSLPDEPSSRGWSAREIKLAIQRTSTLLADYLEKLDNAIAFGKANVKVVDEIPSDLSEYQEGSVFLLREDGKISIHELVDGEVVNVFENENAIIESIETLQSYFDQGKAKKAIKDANGDVIDATYLKIANIVDALDSYSTNKALSANKGRVLQSEIEDTNSTMQSTYETKTDAQSKVSRANLVLIIGEASQLLNGIMSASDKAHLDALYALLGDESDQDTVVNTINEVLALFEQYPEGASIVNALSAKLSKTEAAETYFSKQDGFAIGLVSVTEYDESTGEITIEYNSSAISEVTYDSSTGNISFTY